MIGAAEARGGADGAHAAAQGLPQSPPALLEGGGDTSVEAQVQAWLLQTQAEGLLDGDAMAAMGEGSDSATSELLQEQFAAHDAWVQSLRASAEEVLRRHR